MDPVPLLTLTTALAVVGLGAVLAVTVAGRRRVQRDLEASRAELAALRDRLDRLARRVEPPAGTDTATPGHEFLITSLPDQSSPPASPSQPLGAPALSGREFASVALAESVVRVAALAHGVRRALSAESRNRIGFEMGREVKRSRRQRRRDLKEAKRHLRTEHVSATESTGLAEDAA
jgi:hypothetical protein